ncbi:hypothetical protein AMQ84_06470 [Paenibacillus riograndensis]|uniref:Uncharacterized protein n=1 Tax=Paenibacillus riograndensis TaxID=483937 RepID=A0A132U7U0_9BACL|nr:hypothetical protein [Paenibacillus riograndensis]KWX79555.1 hypothetical protein AMQ84_06470 [Paenibacillus riograndensis]KWX84783.1 hypothetical protein AMQ83_28685 [Paenibacillus riograndensis]
MESTPKIEMLVDALNPVEESVNVITYMLTLHPGREIEILQQIDQKIGDTLVTLQSKVEQVVKQAEESP